MQATSFYCASLVQGVDRGVARVRSSALPIRAGVAAGGLPEKRVYSCVACYVGWLASPQSTTLVAELLLLHSASSRPRGWGVVADMMPSLLFKIPIWTHSLGQTTGDLRISTSINYQYSVFQLKIAPRARILHVHSIVPARSM